MAALDANPSNDPIVAAIDELSSAVKANVEDEKVLAHNLRVMRSRRLKGASTRELITAESSPSTLPLVGRVMLRLGRGSGIFRRSLAHDLRSEGHSVTAIARLFGVTHQRASALLRDDSEPKT
jgi:hypothetical protein